MGPSPYSAPMSTRRTSRLGTEDEFAVYVPALRTAQRRKRNLMRLMDEHGL